MSLNFKTLHFFLGPVQSFVSQARRTRDLWAGSFLLSYLSAQAMAVILQDGGRIIFPEVHDPTTMEPTDPLLSAIIKRARGEDIAAGPAIGSIPNRFKAEIPADFDVRRCQNAVREAWGRLADEVYKRYVQPVLSLGQETKEIWERQVSGFWDMAWVIGENDDLLDRRKNWRTFIPPVESGDKCTIMASWQELSGYERTSGEGRANQEKFWAAMRQKAGELDLREGERLCAISLIKRLFPYVAKEAIGWTVPVNFPSTAYIAAVPWIARSLREKPHYAAAFSEQAKDLDRQSRSVAERFPAIRAALKENDFGMQFAGLGGDLFHIATLENDQLWPTQLSRAQRDAMIRIMREEIGTPTSFYAVLLFDGDRLGELLRKAKSGEVSRALAKFTREVESLITEQNGVLIYAGGDDVLCLLPLASSLKAAFALREAYRAAFAGSILENEATISGSVIYAHFLIPLQSAIAAAHETLDKVAKERTGRDSLAITVWKGAGSKLTWSSPWDCLGLPQEIEGQRNILDKLVADFKGQEPDTAEGWGFSSRFFYHIRERFGLLLSSEGVSLDPLPLLVADYRRNRGLGYEVDISEAEERVKDLLRVSREARRQGNNLDCEGGALNEKGALLVRFLAREGLGK